MRGIGERGSSARQSEPVELLRGTLPLEHGQHPPKATATARQSGRLATLTRPLSRSPATQRASSHVKEGWIDVMRGLARPQARPSSGTLALTPALSPSSRPTQHHDLHARQLQHRNSVHAQNMLAAPPPYISPDRQGQRSNSRATLPVLSCTVQAPHAYISLSPVCELKLGRQVVATRVPPNNPIPSLRPCGYTETASAPIGTRRTTFAKYSLQGH